MTTRRITYSGIALSLTTFFFAGIQTASLADMTVTQEVTTAVAEKKTTFTQTMHWTKSKMRTSAPRGMVVITDLDSKTITILNPKEKKYLQESFEEMKKREAALPAKMREIKLSVQETGEKKTIDGYPCEKLLFKAGQTEIVVWVTRKISVDPAASEFNRKFLELTKDIRGLNIQGQMAEIFQKRKAYGYLTVIEVPLPLVGKTQRTESKVKKVSYDRIDPSVFAVPAGYERMAIPEMPAPK